MSRSAHQVFLLIIVSVILPTESGKFSTRAALWYNFLNSLFRMIFDFESHWDTANRDESCKCGRLSLVSIMEMQKPEITIPNVTSCINCPIFHVVHSLGIFLDTYTHLHLPLLIDKGKSSHQRIGKLREVNLK